MNDVVQPEWVKNHVPGKNPGNPNWKKGVIPKRADGDSFWDSNLV